MRKRSSIVRKLSCVALAMVAILTAFFYVPMDVEASDVIVPATVSVHSYKSNGSTTSSPTFGVDDEVTLVSTSSSDAWIAYRYDFPTISDGYKVGETIDYYVPFECDNSAVYPYVTSKLANGASSGSSDVTGSCKVTLSGYTTQYLLVWYLLPANSGTATFKRLEPDFVYSGYPDPIIECTCNTKCTEESVNDLCELCSSDYSACTGIDDSVSVCICDLKCAEDSVNTDCSVCVDDYANCVGLNQSSDSDDLWIDVEDFFGYANYKPLNGLSGESVYYYSLPIASSSDDAYIESGSLGDSGIFGQKYYLYKFEIPLRFNLGIDERVTLDGEYRFPLLINVANLSGKECVYSLIASECEMYDSEGKRVNVGVADSGTDTSSIVDRWFGVSVNMRFDKRYIDKEIFGTLTLYVSCSNYSFSPDANPSMRLILQHDSNHLFFIDYNSLKYVVGDYGSTPIKILDTFNTYDDSQGNSVNGNFSASLDDYTTTEDSLWGTATSNLESFAFFDLSTVPLVVTGISFVTSIMSGWFEQSGGADGVGIVLSILFSVMLVSMALGLYRLYQSQGHRQGKSGSSKGGKK